jgi:hypothetical protein
MKLDLWAIMKASFNPTAIKTFLFFLLFAIFLIIVKSIANRYLKKLDPKPLKTSTLVIILVTIGILMVFVLQSLGK